MRIVAVRAGHFAFDQRMVRGFIHLAALLFMTGVANLGLSNFVEHFVAVDVNFVTGVASHVGTLVGTARPQRARAVLAVAGHAYLAALIGGQCKLAYEQAIGQRATLCAILFAIVRMVVTGTVAADAIGHPFVGGEPVR